MKTPVHYVKNFITYADGRKPHWTIDYKAGWLDSKVEDKNGIKIFEGDKVKARTPDGDDEVGVVVFDTGTFMWESAGWATELDSGGIYDLEVIGHIAEENQDD